MIQRHADGSISLGKLEFFIQVLIVLNLIAFAVETLPNLSESTCAALRTFEVASVLIFTVEYLTRLSLTRPWHRYAFSFFGIIDLLAVLPFYIVVGFDLRSARAFRLLRLIRVFKLTKYSAAMQRMSRAFVIAREEIVLFGAISIIVLYLSAVGIYFFENEAQPEHFSSIFESLWWAICTLTTVGYGDVYAITTGGRIFTFFILIIGVGIVAIPTGLFASALLRVREDEKE
ncbi:MAG: ion transporter [Verrucomicrobia bacterium]|nr:ion transporter [Verrucomicrobiota bacterium]